MGKRGRTPSLVGGGAGTSRFVQAHGKRHCKHCGTAIAKGRNCVEVAVPGSMGRRTYCTSCYGEILGKSRKDLDKLEGLLSNLE